MTDKRARLEPPDISEKGGLKGGQQQRSDERLFMQLFAFTNCTDLAGRHPAAGRRGGSSRSFIKTSTTRKGLRC